MALPIIWCTPRCYAMFTMYRRGILSLSKQINIVAKVDSLISKQRWVQTSTDAQSAPSVLQSGLTSRADRGQKISKAMKAYLQRAQDYDEFMKKADAEYEIGKRHLANMMGKDPDSFTQYDIDKAIEYLMPSGLFEPTARPMMKPPKQIFPKKKAAQFDTAGRPFHCFFYTGKPNYYQALHDIACNMELLNKFEDDLIRKGIKNPEAELRLNIKGSQWLSKDLLEKKLIETLRDDEYNYFTVSMSRLADHVYSKQVENFIMSFRKPLVQETMTMEIPPLKYDEKGRPYMTATGKRKWAVAEVTVWGNGTGEVSINGKDINYFQSLQCREQIMFPLQFTNMWDEVDLVATVRDGGLSSQAGAIRYATSLALRSFLTKDEVEKMRLAGLLTWDPRVHERKKYGQKGARGKWTWKKR